MPTTPFKARDGSVLIPTLPVNAPNSNRCVGTLWVCVKDGKTVARYPVRGLKATRADVARVFGLEV